MDQEGRPRLVRKAPPGFGKAVPASGKAEPAEVKTKPELPLWRPFPPKRRAHRAPDPAMGEPGDECPADAVCVESRCGNTAATHKGQKWKTELHGWRYRCNVCNAWRSRLTNARSPLTEEEKLAISEWGPEQRQAFKEKYKHLRIGDLSTALRTEIEELDMQYSDRSLDNTGHFKDKEDITEKYKNKPDQLKNILERAETIECPTRGVTLYEDPDVKAKHISGSRTERTVKRKLEQQQDNFIPREKKAKAAKEANEDKVARPAPAGKPLSEQLRLRAVKQSTAAKEKIGLAEAALRRLIDEPKLREWIHPSVR